MKHLEEEYGFLKVNYKIFHPNLLRNDEYIKFHVKIHQDFTFDKPSVVTKKKHINKITKKGTKNNVNEKNARVSKHKYRKENEIQYIFTYY